MAESQESRAARNKRYYENRKAKMAAAPDADRRLKISDDVLARARRKPQRGAVPAPTSSPFAPYKPAPGVIPAGSEMAMDSAEWSQTANWAQNAIGSAYAEGQEFLGYPELSLMAQRPEYRVMSETIAEEMTRRWIKFTTTGDDDKSEKIAKIDAEFRRLNVRATFKELAEQDGFFGRSHLYLDTGDGDNPAELQTPIGDGRNEISRNKIGAGKGRKPVSHLRTVEAVWTYPAGYNSNDPLSAGWYKPDKWLVMGKTIHSSRLLTFVGREVPDLLKPAYSFGGLSLSQMAKPYVDNWLKVRQGTTDAVTSYSVFVLETDLSTLLTPSGDDLFRRADLFNNLRNNRSLMMINKDAEAFQNVSQTLAGLHELQAQAQEHMAAVCKIPLVKLLGISPTGLNASSEGEMRSFNDMIHAYQERLFRQNLTRVLGFVQLSLFGETDPEIDFEFENLTELTDKESAEVRKTEAETDQIMIDTGVISPEEARKRVAGDDATPYAGLDVEDAPDMLEEEAGGLDPKGSSGRSDGAADCGIPAMDALFDLSQYALDTEFEESKHPRAGNGQFGSGGSEGVKKKSAKPKLTPTEKSYLSSYTGDDFLETNAKLRKGEDGGASVGHIDSAIGKSEVPAGKKLYRGMTREDAKKLFPDGDIQVGGIVSDPAFLSTTDDKDMADTFFGMGGVVLEISPGEGQKGLDTSGFSRNTQEKEFLLPRNTKLKVTGIRAPKKIGEPVTVRVSSIPDA